MSDFWIISLLQIRQTFFLPISAILNWFGEEKIKRKNHKRTWWKNLPKNFLTDRLGDDVFLIRQLMVFFIMGDLMVVWLVGLDGCLMMDRLDGFQFEDLMLFWLEDLMIIWLVGLDGFLMMGRLDGFRLEDLIVFLMMGGLMFRTWKWITIWFSLPIQILCWKISVIHP